jgi:hypothetical protein
VILYDHADRTTTVRRQAAEGEQIRHCLRHEREARKVGEFEVVWCDAHDGQEVAVLAAARKAL